MYSQVCQDLKVKGTHPLRKTKTQRVRHPQSLNPNLEAKASATRPVRAEGLLPGSFKIAIEPSLLRRTWNFRDAPLLLLVATAFLWLSWTWNRSLRQFSFC